MAKMYLRSVVPLMVLLFGFVLTVPLPPPQNQEELLKDFAEFLRENEGVALALRNVDMDRVLSRSRRQAEDPMMDVEEMDPKEPSQKEAGFFDRAAKFMMEVLQRFLKWINTDN